MIGSPAPLDPRIEALARSTPGFMPHEEGLALYDAVFSAPAGPHIEIGSYCGRSALYLGAAAHARGERLFSLDHHMGSEEHQPGEGYHEPELTDPVTGRVNTLPRFLRTLDDARELVDVCALIGTSSGIARVWETPPASVFIDGGHSSSVAHRDLDAWGPKLMLDGLLLIHDVFPDPADGGRPPFEIYRRALDSSCFEEVSATNSLRVLRKIKPFAAPADRR